MGKRGRWKEERSSMQEVTEKYRVMTNMWSMSNKEMYAKRRMKKEDRNMIEKMRFPERRRMM